MTTIRGALWGDGAVPPCRGASPGQGGGGEQDQSPNGELTTTQTTARTEAHCGAESHRRSRGRGLARSWWSRARRASSASRQRKRRDESARTAPHRHVAAAQRHTTTLPGTRTHGQSAFTQECSRGSPSPFGRLRIVLRSAERAHVRDALTCPGQSRARTGMS